MTVKVRNVTGRVVVIPEVSAVAVDVVVDVSNDDATRLVESGQFKPAAATRLKRATAKRKS